MHAGPEHSQYHNNEEKRMMMKIRACCGGFPATEPQDWGVRSGMKSGSWAGVPIRFRNYWKLISSHYDTSSFWSINEFQPKLQQQNISKYRSGFPEKRVKAFLLFLGYMKNCLSPDTHREKKVGFKWRLCVIIHVKLACTSFKLNRCILMRHEECLFTV